MGEVVAFPRRHRFELDRPDAGSIHVYRVPEGDYEIGHESRSGDSWGHFERHPTPWAAISAAHRLNSEFFGGLCDIHLARHVCHDINRLQQEGGR